MSIPARPARLHRFYDRYLEDQNAARFVRDVAGAYLTSTLERLTRAQPSISRRAAVLALSLLGDFRNNAAVGAALQDEDRGVRMLAECGIREIWMRSGSPAQQRRLRRIARLNTAGEAERSLRESDELIAEEPRIAEAWNQRAVAWFQCEQYVQSARDCRQTLRLNPFHFGAAIGQGHCQLEFHDPWGALRSFRRALEICPDLDNVRQQARYLEQALADHDEPGR